MTIFYCTVQPSYYHLLQGLVPFLLFPLYLVSGLQPDEIDNCPDTFSDPFENIPQSYDDNIYKSLQDLDGIKMETLVIEKDLTNGRRGDVWYNEPYRTGRAHVTFETSEQAKEAVKILQTRKIGGNKSLATIWTRTSTRFDFIHGVLNF